MPLYRHRADIYPSLLILTVFTAQLTLLFSDLSPLRTAGFVALLALSQVSAGAICHNHHHLNTFTRPNLNRLLEVLMYLQTGTSPFSWTLHHNIGHHGRYLDQTRDPSTWQLPDGRMMARLHYDLYNSVMIYPQIWRIGREFPALFARFKRWFVISNLVLLGLLLVDPVKAAIIFLLPMSLMLVVLLDNTYLQHSGLETDDHHHASRNILHPLYNFTSFNLGYHTAHHMHPGLHWTLLPEVHAQIAHRIPRGLISHRLFPQRSELRVPEPLASAD